MVPSRLYETDTTIHVADSKIGWAKALRELTALLWTGHIPKWDVSQVRPKGAVLKTFGGRASGPAPLIRLFEFLVSTFKKASGRKLTPIECHDICCMIGDIVVVGGVIPQQDYQFLYDAGVHAIYGPGSNIPEAASDVLKLIPGKNR